MAESDFNFIPPVEHLNSVPSLTPAKDREERKRRHRAAIGKREPAGQDEPEQNDGDSGDSQSHSIDYCA
ncbi:MAG: hypothetical protein JW955_01350 [Sedimentisphaerales bacterium]|nr:hypothetical protein [Sedimentisphaerales bacterium]